MTMKGFLKKVMFLAAMSCACGAMGCSDDGSADIPEQAEPTDPVVDTGFAKGADVSWLTEMESRGVKFYDKAGNEKECMALMKELGVNAIRLRVWVDPEAGWNGKADVLAKAKRADALGMRLMIDFHYSDTWADPARQDKPKAWEGYGLEQLKQAVADHTADVLQALKGAGVDVDWVQVGNETSGGMLWETGRAYDQVFGNFVQLINSGYDAVKSVYPEAKVIIHLNNGFDLQMFTWMFNGLCDNGAKYDVIGMSLYPEADNWQTLTDQCLRNIDTLSDVYGKDVMLCEIGMPWDAPFAVEAMTKMMDGCKAAKRCLGIFYWEPECHNGWNGYTKGAFDDSGKPTAVMDTFGKR